MKKYVFDKSIYLGYLKKNFNSGTIIEMDENNLFIFGEQINDMRDINICIKKGYVIPFEGSRFDVSNVEVNAETDNKESDTFLGFKVEREEEIGNVIPLNNFKPTVLDESKAFIEEDGKIIQPTSRISVTPAVTNSEITKSTEVESETENLVEPLSAKTSTKRSNTKTVKDKVTKSSSNVKKSKVAEKMAIENEKVTGEVRGMNIIKSE